jgi:flagellin-like hook-associated protein FlgL
MDRISFQQSFGKSRGYILDAFARTESLQEKVSTGRNINRPSDDPLGLALAQHYKTSTNQDTMYLKNMDDAKAWMETTENVMNSSLDIIQNVRAQVVRAADEVNFSAADREAIAVQLDAAIEELLSKANTRLTGRYIFSGFRTFTQSYTVQPDGTIRYGGNVNEIKREIGDNHQITINMDGISAFQDAFDELIRLRADLRNQAVRPESFRLNDVELRNAASLFSKLDAPSADPAEPLSAYLRTLPALAGVLAGYPPGPSTQQQEALIAALNTRVIDPPVPPPPTAPPQNLYDASTAAARTYLQKAMTAETKALLATNPAAGSDEFRKLNRHILEDAYNYRKDFTPPASNDSYLGEISSSFTRHLTALDSIISSMDKQRTALGERVAAVERLRAQTRTTLTNLKEFIARKEDADMPTVITQMQAAQNLYSASINVAGRVLQESLMNFLR